MQPYVRPSIRCSSRQYCLNYDKINTNTVYVSIVPLKPLFYLQLESCPTQFLT